MLGNRSFYFADLSWSHPTNSPSCEQRESVSHESSHVVKVQERNPHPVAISLLRVWRERENEGERWLSELLYLQGAVFLNGFLKGLRATRSGFLQRAVIPIENIYFLFCKRPYVRI